MESRAPLRFTVTVLATAGQSLWLNHLTMRSEKNAFKHKKKKPGLKFNPGLALIGLRTLK